MPSSLTFGLEYELKLKITKAELQSMLSDDGNINHVEIVTNPGPVRLTNVGPEYLQKSYVNFAFRDAQSSSASPNKSVLVNKMTGQPSELRGYSDEALKILQRRLQTIPGYDHDNTAIYRGTSKKQTDFSSARLHLTTDASLSGITKATKIAENLCPGQEPEDVDFVGTEIVTAPHSSLQGAREEANAISAALRDNYHIDDECALHIHVGRPDGRPLSTNTLQHLAYLCIVYEHEISAMAVPRKRGCDFETMSNRNDFATECPPPTERPVFLADQNGNISQGSQEVTWNYESLPAIRQAIFDNINSTENPLEAFVKLIGSHKGRIVNFSYCARDITKGQGAATVEFRQHQGTLSGDDIFHWARHCTALVALAERYAETNTFCPITEWDDTITIEDLWREMHLPEATKHHYRNRILEYAQKYPDAQPIPLFEPPLFFDDDFEDDWDCTTSESDTASVPSMTEIVPKGKGEEI